MLEYIVEMQYRGTQTVKVKARNSDHARALAAAGGAMKARLTLMKAKSSLSMKLNPRSQEDKS